MTTGRIGLLMLQYKIFIIIAEREALVVTSVAETDSYVLKHHDTCIRPFGVC